MNKQQLKSAQLNIEYQFNRMFSELPASDDDKQDDELFLSINLTNSVFEFNEE